MTLVNELILQPNSMDVSGQDSVCPRDSELSERMKPGEFPLFLPGKFSLYVLPQKTLEGTGEVVIVDRGRPSPPEVNVDEATLTTGDGDRKIAELKALKILLMGKGKRSPQEIPVIKLLMKSDFP